MNSTGKIALGLGIASGLLLATWLLTGSRKQKTKHFINKKAFGLRDSLRSSQPRKKSAYDDSCVYYI